MVEPIERSDISVDIKMGELRDDPLTTISEGATTTSTSTLISNFEIAGETTLPHRPTAFGIVEVSQKFLQ